MLVTIFHVNLSTEGGGSTDPHINTQLARAMDDAKSKNIPNATMTEHLRKLVSRVSIAPVYAAENTFKLFSCQSQLQAISEQVISILLLVGLTINLSFLV